MTNRAPLYDRDGDGIVDADRVEQEPRGVINVDDHGADDTGGTSSDSAFSNAVSAADAGDIILFKDGTYLLENTHTISKPLVLKGVNVTLNRTTGKQGSSTWYEDAMFTFMGGGPTGTSSALTADLQRGSTAVTVNDASLFNAGDYVSVHDNTSYQDQFDARNTFARVTDIDTTNNIVSLSVDAKWDHLTANDATMYQMEFLEGARIEGFDCVGDGSNTSSWMKLQYCRDFVVEDVSIDGFIYNAISPASAWRGEIRNCSIRNAYLFGGSEGEAFQAFKSQDIRLIAPETQNVRRGTDMTKQCSDMYIYDPCIHTQNMGITMHNGEGGRNLNVYGGEVNDQSNSGGCLIAEDGGDMSVYSTDIYFSDRAINIDGGKVYARGLTVRPSDSVNGGMAELLQMNAGEFDAEIDYDNEGYSTNQLFEVQPTNGDIKKFHLTFNGSVGSPDRGIWLLQDGTNNIENVRISGDVTGSGGGTYFIFFDTLTGSLTKNVRIHDFGLTNWGGEGVRTTGDGGIDDVKISNCSMNTSAGSNICVRLGGDNAYDQLTNVWIEHNFFVTDSGSGEIYCGEPGVDYLWIRDNKGDVTLTGSETNVVQNGNQA